MATRSQPFCRTHFTISSTGLPNASSASAGIPAASNSVRTFFRYSRSSVISRLTASGPYVLAAHPSATCSNTNRLCIAAASGLMWSMIARSVVVPSSVTRIVSYITLPSARDHMPRRAHRFRQSVYIHDRDQDSARPARNHQKPSISPRPHSLLRTGEMQQRKHGKWKLQCQHHLAERQQIGHSAISTQSDDNDRRQNRQCARDQPPHPRLYPPVHESFHHHLTRKRSGDRAALPARQQRHREQCTGRHRP